ncbi:bifunctional phosphopantothenoylcysteine decarboxylase/phosphopantothenate synthase [Leucobacter tenebrionis]|uniref:bifunctional phosphopantothenoylcysteine decarboxylase/phosphopantothenate synthase n=1 Tax=Leucobacter tenebrionis TaxID=2873270 RepID=UPI001CA6DE62|nr:bifunctional phosphopantothenoylcysteine decarboxylase/phosphopantothenate synthase [Leucobacter tenebrionis]QZY52476.1 bifunctional phosphopantothenoylcysteine decarboxylase/phosphopantothenate synthase [Leucobacter tenebrionis]
MNIVLGVTGGIAAYKAVALARLLVETGHEVHVVPTDDALRFVGRPTWEAISRHPVTTSVHEDVPEVRHVALGQRADLVVVAPATANTLARMTAGLADDLLGTTLLATRAPVLVAPAMHTEMWQHPATQDNVAILRSRGVRFVGPESGRLTGDDSGPGRMSEPEQIARAIESLLGGETDPETPDDAARGADPEPAGDSAADPDLHPQPEFDARLLAEPAEGAEGARDLDGVRVLVTAGGTREPIDPVRYLGNRSSGRQGVAIAAAAADRGAKVVLLAANIDESVLAQVRDRAAVRVVPIGTTAELETAAHAAASGAEVVIMAAAVADYRVANVADQKLRKEDSPGEAPVLELVENPDVLVGLVRERRPGQVIVGFAAETVAGGSSGAEAGETGSGRTELLERGRRKLARKGVDLLAVNAVGWNAGFESDDNSLLVLDADGGLAREAHGSKREVADRLLDAVRDELR